MQAFFPFDKLVCKILGFIIFFPKLTIDSVLFIVIRGRVPRYRK